MSNEQSGLVSAALDEWRLHDIERDWDAVRSRASAARSRVPRRRIAFVAVGLAVAAPAIAAVGNPLSWPWSHRPGAELVASVPSLPGTALRLDSHGALVVRTSRGVRFLSPAPTRQRRRFVWQLTAGTPIAGAEIVLPRKSSIELCSPCADGENGKFTVAGSRALDILNGQAKLRLRTGNGSTTSPIHLQRLR
jgi:hypothetical protein